MSVLDPTDVKIPWGTDSSIEAWVRGPAMMDRPWTDFAECLGHDPDMFFPEIDLETDGVGRATTADAKKICSHCPVVSECLEDALTRNDMFGVRGNTSPAQRRVMRRDRNGGRLRPGRRSAQASYRREPATLSVSQVARAQS